MWTVRELSNSQLRVGVEVVDTKGRPGVITYLTTEGYDTFAWVQFEGDVEPSLAIKNGDSDLQVTGFGRY
jgi:hypothetical protein